MIDFTFKEKYGFEDLLHIMEILRAPDGCMWDREQDHHSIRRNFIEETYEAVEAIDNDDPVLLREELGDVLLQVVFHAQMEKEKGVFDIGDVADGVCKKLIYRHPHIFGSTEVGSTEEILNNWDELKKKEKSQNTVTDSLESVARSLPGLIRADKVQKEAEAALGGKGDPEDEIGDLLFAAVNVSRFMKVEPEHAMERACDEFIRRFARVEELAGEDGLQDKSLDELEALWQQAKAEPEGRA